MIKLGFFYPGFNCITNYMLNLLKNRFFQRKYLLFFLLVLITILPRFIFLDRVPEAVNNDELHYALNAKSFALTGKDTTGKITPLDILLFKYPGNEMIQAELPYFLEMPSPWVKLSPRVGLIITFPCHALCFCMPWPAGRLAAGWAISAMVLSAMLSPVPLPCQACCVSSWQFYWRQSFLWLLWLLFRAWLSGSAIL